MYKQIYKIIKKYNKIIIARHKGVDPDAMASQIGLRDSIRLTFPEKEVYAIGSAPHRFSYIGKLDKPDDLSNALLIVCDTPDLKRIDGADPANFLYTIKIDHHPFIDDFGGLEYIVPEASSASELVMELIDETRLKCNSLVAQTLYYGLVSDSNRFLFSTSSYKTFALVSKFLKEYPFDITHCYNKLYARPLNEVRLKGYIASNMNVTESGVAYIDITDELQSKYGVDSAAAGNMVNDFNFINEVLVWLTITEDIKLGLIRISIRSRGPVINKVAEAHNGGGHAYASGAKVTTFEEAHEIVKELNEVCEKYINENKLGD